MEEGGEASLYEIVGAAAIHENDYLMVCYDAIKTNCLRCRHSRQSVEADLRDLK